MPRGLRQTVRDNLEKCKACTLAAVEAYNRPGPRFRTAQYLVMIVMAWTALFHAIFYHRGRRPWYRRNPSRTGKAIRYVKVDGEPKHWDLSECLKQYFGSRNPPERHNLQFLLRLRNKIEHRHLPGLDAGLYGECQAALLNLEELLVNEFGQRHALSEQLAVSLQFSRTTPAEKREAARVLASSTATSVIDYVERFRGNLPSTVLNSMKYSYNVFLIPKVVNRESMADTSVEFVRADEASPEEIERISRLNVLIREKRIPIANLDLLKPSDVVEQLRQVLPFEVSMATHTRAWQHFGVRPKMGDQHPEQTISDFCIYDQVHGDYLYRRAWIEKLTRDLSDPVKFKEVTGRDPVRRA